MRFLVVFIVLLISSYSYSTEVRKARIVLIQGVDIQVVMSNVELLVNNEEYILGEGDLSLPIPIFPNGKKTTKRKVIAISLAVTLGVFGVHRLYLGTSTKVPIIYTLTLGGGFGVLVVSDIIAILATKNLDAFSPNERVFMWAE